jgi:hypothetical protein
VAALAWVGKRRYLAAAPPSTAIDQDTQPNQDDEQTAVRRRPQPSQLDRGSDDYLALIEDDLLEADRRELPLGRSTDPAIDDELSRSDRGDETSGAALFPEPEPDRPISEDISLDQIWDAAPRSEKDAEGYDAVTPEGENDDPNEVQEDDLDIDEKP